MYLPFLFAKRYLFAKKSHNVINIISTICVCGMAVGTAALIVILSVYNGFGSIVRDSLSDINPDLQICASRGKTFVPEGEAFDWAYDQDAIATMSSVLEENVYLSYSGRDAVALAKGVDSVFEEESAVREHMVEGEFSLHKGEVPLAAVGISLATEMDISPRFLGGISLYFPDSSKPFSMANPLSSLQSVKVFPSGIYSINSNTDNGTLIIPLEKMRELLNLDKEVSSVELRFAEGTSARVRKKTIKTLSEKLGAEFTLRDRFQQNESLYKMMRYEKVSVYLILIFVVIIIAFNVFSSLSMLMIEKEEDMETLRSLGADEKLCSQIFVLEGWMISLLGLAVGLCTGIILVLLQQEFGVLKMPANFSISAYPVILKAQDVLITATSVAVIGYIIARLPVIFSSRR